MGKNPRYANGNQRRKYRARFKAMGAPCGICKGKLGPIRYDEPSDAQHPLSFVIDEIKPISRYRPLPLWLVRTGKLSSPKLTAMFIA